MRHERERERERARERERERERKRGERWRMVTTVVILESLCADFAGQSPPRNDTSARVQH